MFAKRLRLASGLGLLALMTALTATLLVAQEKEATKRQKGEPAPKGEPAVKGEPGDRFAGKGGTGNTTFYLVLRTGPNEVDSDILDNLTTVLEVSKATYEGKPKIKAVSPVFFEEFAELIDQAAPPANVGDGKLSVKRLAARETSYELSIEPTEVLTKLIVTYKSKKTVEYKPAGPAEKNPPLVATAPGRYAFTPPAGEIPASYILEINEFGKPDSVKKGEWPESNKYFVVTLKKFVGDKDVLFANLRNKKYVPNAFDVKRADDYLFAFADLNTTVAKTGPGIVSIDAITLNAEDLAESEVSRVWMYFPVDDEGIKKAVEKFRAEGMRGKELSEAIQANFSPATDGKAVLNDIDGPKWYELPRVPKENATKSVGFARTFTVDSLRKFYDKYKTLNQLIVWEFQNGTTKAAIKVQHPKQEIGTVFALDREWPGWKIEVEDVLKKNKK